jgi:hypothetical protein
MLGETPAQSRSYQLPGCHEHSVNCHGELLTKAGLPLFKDQIEKAVNPSYGTKRRGWFRKHRTAPSLLGRGEMRGGG